MNLTFEFKLLTLFASLDKTFKYETPSLSNDKDKFALHTHKG